MNEQSGVEGYAGPELSPLPASTVPRVVRALALVGACARAGIVVCWRWAACQSSCRALRARPFLPGTVGGLVFVLFFEMLLFGAFFPDGVAGRRARMRGS